jgi:endonuclease YncB( thermonuclease family)
MGTVISYRHARRARFDFYRRYFGFLALAFLLVGAGAIGVWQPHTITAPEIQISRPAQHHIAQNPHVVDGDTLYLGRAKFRLIGIDAPELHQDCRDAQGHKWACGQAAKARLVELVSGAEVTCATRSRDYYGRALAVCSTAAVPDLGEALVRDGYALNYSRYTRAYLAAEREAQASRRGIWRGDFEDPENWRHRQPRS